jgi:hypothetical protein
MGAILKPVKKVVGGLAGGLLNGILGGRAPAAPEFRPAPSILDNAQADNAALAQRKKRSQAQGRASTILSLADESTQNPVKTLLGG